MDVAGPGASLLPAEVLFPGAKVSIPCKKELIAILEKYNYEMPHFEDQTINRHIKADQLDVVQKLTDKYDYFD